MSPSEVYEMQEDGHQQREVCIASIVQQQQLYDWEIQEIFDDVSVDLSTYEQYYVDVDGEDAHSAQAQIATPLEDGEESGFLSFLQLPRIQLPLY